MVRLEWTSPAFLVLETLPQTVAFDIVRRVDLLPVFPKMGAKFDSRFPTLRGYRQIIVKRNYRVIYDFDEFENRIYILSVQHCRQKLPSARDLKRKEADE
jgi:mRNA-degrading endonuclease RelE of RelBE toxin-antitoxin system